MATARRLARRAILRDGRMNSELLDTADGLTDVIRMGRGALRAVDYDLPLLGDPRDDLVAHRLRRWPARVRAGAGGHPQRVGDLKVVARHAALAALPGPRDCVEDMRRTCDVRHGALCEGLAVGLGATALCEPLLRDGRVLVFPGLAYGDDTDDFVRLSLTVPVEQIKGACARMSGVVRDIDDEAAEGR